MCRLLLMNKQAEKEIEKTYGLEKYLTYLEKQLGGHGNGYLLVKDNKILTVEEEMDPIIVKFRTSLKSDFTRMLLANSITLTPGTITISLEDDENTIHCLDTSLAEGLENSDFEKALKKLDGEE